MELASQSCVPCQGGIDPIEPEVARGMLAEVPGWELVHDGKRLERTFRFSNFIEANRFADAVGALAEQQDHHPEITFGWGYVRVAIWSHKIDGLHQNDFIFAAHTNGLPGAGS